MHNKSTFAMDAFYLKLITAFLVGSAWITISTIISEKLGTKPGGVLGGLPSTVVVSLLFIGWAQGAQAASEATGIMPLVIGISALFVVTYVIVARYNFYLAIIAALAVWLILSLSLARLHFNNFAYSLAGFVLLLALSYYVLERKLHIISQGKKSVRYTIPQLAIRAILSGSVIAFAIIMAKIGGPILGGTFAAFPAVTLSTAIITYIAHGREFSAAVMKILMISGTVNIVAFIIGVRYTYPHLGLAYGTLVSFAISLIAAYLVYAFVNKNVS